MRCGKQPHLDGFAFVRQHLPVHLLHGRAGLRGFGELDVGDAFGLLGLPVFDDPDPLDVPESGETFAELIFGDAATRNQEQPAVGRIVEVFRDFFLGIVLHLLAQSKGVLRSSAARKF